MTKTIGAISKMETTLSEPVSYKLVIGNERIDMNGFIGTEVSLTWTNKIECMNCGRSINKTFAQGYCYPCFASIPETEDCVLRPELCRAHEGIARDMEWATDHCLQPHIVYLALSSEMKVGITRISQIPTRWIDQGASKAIVLAQTPNRYTAGIIEVELKKHLTDKTNWRNMLANKIADIDLVNEKNSVAQLLPDNLKEFISNDNTITHIEYPHLSFPAKVTSIDIEKHTKLQGQLTAIKGQYLIFDNANVINMRKYGGYVMEFTS